MVAIAEAMASLPPLLPTIAQSSLTCLAGGSRLLFKLVLFVRRFFVADGFCLFFVDGLLFQRPWSGESRRGFMRSRHSAIGMTEAG